jgi:hypothetical protein
MFTFQLRLPVRRACVRTCVCVCVCVCVYVRAGAQVLCICRCSQINVYDKDKDLTGIIMRFYIIIVKTRDFFNFISKYNGLTFNNTFTKNM